MARWVFALCCLSASASAQGAAPAEPARLSPKQVEVVKKGVRAALKDPESARFDRPFQAVADPTGATNVCGYVNSRNSYGGYTGNVAFGGMLMKQGAAFMVFGIGAGGPQGDYSVRATCAQAGVALD